MRRILTVLLASSMITGYLTAKEEKTKKKKKIQRQQEIFQKEKKGRDASTGSGSGGGDVLNEAEDNSNKKQSIIQNHKLKCAVNHASALSRFGVLLNCLL